MDGVTNADRRLQPNIAAVKGVSREGCMQAYLAKPVVHDRQQRVATLWHV